MLLLRILLLATGLAVVAAPGPALAAPTLPPTFYLPAPEELPPGFTILSTSGAGEVAGSVQQQQNYYRTEPNMSAFTFLLVSRDRSSATKTMAQKKALSEQLSEHPAAYDLGDESFMTAVPGMYSDDYTFVVRIGLVVVHLTLNPPTGSMSAADADALARAFLAPTLTRMAEHPDGV